MPNEWWGFVVLVAFTIGLGVGVGLTKSVQTLDSQWCPTLIAQAPNLRDALTGFPQCAEFLAEETGE